MTFVKVNLIHPDAIVPSKGSKDAAGFDLYMVSASHEFSGDKMGHITIHPGKRVFVQTGVQMQLPVGTYGRIAPRSGLAAKYGLNTLAGVIDRDYTGELVVILHNTGNVSCTLEIGDRVAQLIVEQYLQDVHLIEAGFDGTERGEGGFGSTGA